MISKATPNLFEEGPFKELFLEYVDYKRACGLQYDDSILYTLRCMNNKLNKYAVDTPVLTKTMVEDLCAKRDNETYSTQSKRIGIVRLFAVFLRNRGIEAYVNQERTTHGESSSFVPYIFSKQEIVSIFNAADCLAPLSRYPAYTMIYPVLVRLLYSCGLRLSEALSLQYQDIDMEQGTLFVNKSKNNKSRIVPMASSMTEACMIYSRKMQLSCKKDGYFFPSPNGGKYSRNSVRITIKNIYAKAGIPKLPNGHYPRVHDVRHTQAVHAFIKMQEEGMDLYLSLPILCAYLGHSDIRSTEKYLRLPYFKYDEVAQSSHKLVPGLIPEVNWDEE